MKQAFSLVELSIVLVILGLLTGGILTGQNLIRAAELRSVTTQVEAYRTAIYTFRDKYFALPGDMTNATDFWGAMTTGTCPAATAGTGTQTCNGDGDGTIEATAASAAQTAEMYMAWQHLANAGLIEGSYTGINAGTGGTYVQVLGENVPATKISSAGISLVHAGNRSGDSFYYDGSYGNIFSLGIDTGPNGPLGGGFLIAEEAWNIDKKIDDGKPSYGFILAAKSTPRPNCTTTDVVSTAEYNLTNTSLSASSCPIIVKTKF